MKKAVAKCKDFRNSLLLFILRSGGWRRLSRLGCRAFSAIQWPLFIHNFFTAPEYPAFLLHFKGVFPLLQKLLEVFPLHALKHICAVLREIAALLAQSIQLLHHINEGGKRDHLHVAIFIATT